LKSSSTRFGIALTFLATVTSMVVAACAPAGPQAGQRETTAGGTPSAPSVLRVAITTDAEPKELGLAFGSISSGAAEPRYMLHAPLTIRDDKAEIQPRLVERVATVENGDWKMTPDGKMEVTWKLRPDARWHDGAAFTSADMVLGWKITKEPELGLGSSIHRQIDDVVAIDPQTVVVKWKNVYVFGNDMGMQVVPPVHSGKLGPLFEAGDMQAFQASPLWSEQWVGLGPYKMGQWVRGSLLEMSAYDDYFLGRPKIDRVSIHYFGDTRSLIVSTIAGDVDLVPVGSMKAEEANVLKQEWESKGSGKVVLSANKLRNGDYQFREASAPWMDARVRQAMTMLLDRTAMVETLHNGLSTADDLFLLKDEPAYALARQKQLPNLAYDVAGAHRLMTQAGYTRGSDGIYRTADGTPFVIEMTTTNDINTNVQELLAISDAWKTNGIDSKHTFISSADDKDAIRGQVKGVNLTSTALGLGGYNAYISAEIRSAQTRWKGSNIGGYNNPAYDQMYSRALTLVSATERDALTADIAKFALDEQLYLPLVYSNDVSANATKLKGITQVTPNQRLNAWNVHLWTIG
jgi:peptide/nickel transport system substrate-binding protein